MQARPLGDASREAVTVSESARASARDAPVNDEMRRARAAEYMLLANLLARAPTAELLAGMAAIRGDASPLGMAHVRLADAAAKISADDASREFFQLFVGVGRGEIVPYASFYLTGFLHERPLARVREDMGRLGIERQAGVFEPEDRASTLFEIMAGLVRGDFDTEPGEADTFFARHIAPWAPRLMADIGVAPSARLYTHIAHYGSVWLGIEQDAMALPE